MTWYVTNSEVSSFRRCPRQWYLGYVLGLEPARERLVPPRFRGTLVHSALQVYYENIGDPLDYIISEGVRAEQSYFDRTEEPDKEELEEIRKTVDLAHAMVEGYLEWVAVEGVDAGLELIATEQEVAVPFVPAGRLCDEDIQLLGKLDAKFKREFDGFTFFMDHKTVGDLVQLPRWGIMHTQFLHYHLIERLASLSTRTTDGGMFNMLRTVKRSARSNPPYYARSEVRHNDTQLRNYYQRLYLTIEKMANLRNAQALPPEIAYDAVPDQTCAWGCSFFMLCPMMDDGSDWRGLMLEAYREADPLERYVSIEKG